MNLRSQFTNAFWYPDEGDFSPHKQPTYNTKRSNQARWKLTNKSAEIVFYGRAQGDLFTLPDYFCPGYSIRLNSRNSRVTFTS
jgi:hypothetical protein